MSSRNHRHLVLWLFLLALMPKPLPAAPPEVHQFPTDQALKPLPEPIILGGGGRPLGQALKLTGDEIVCDSEGREWTTLNNQAVPFQHGAPLAGHSVFLVLQTNAQQEHGLWGRTGRNWDDFTALRWLGDGRFQISGERSDGGAFRLPVTQDPMVGPEKPFLLQLRAESAAVASIQLQSAELAIPSALKLNTFGAGYATAPKFSGLIGELRLYPVLAPAQHEHVAAELNAFWGLAASTLTPEPGFRNDFTTIGPAVTVTRCSSLRVAFPAAAAERPPVWFGHSGEPLRFVVEEGLPSEVTMRFARRWYSSGVKTPLALQFDLSSASDLRLADGHFGLLHRSAPTAPFTVIAESRNEAKLVNFDLLELPRGEFTLAVINGPLVKSSQARIALDGMAVGQRFAATAGRLLQVTAVGLQANPDLTLREQATGIVWYHGPARDFRLDHRLIRSGDIELTAGFAGTATVLPGEHTFVLTVAGERELSPGLWFRLIRPQADEPFLPAADRFAPRQALATDLATEMVYESYPAYRTCPSVFPPATGLGNGTFTPADYYHGTLAHPCLSADAAVNPLWGGDPAFPLGDLLRKERTAALIQGECLIHHAGDHAFRVSSSMPVRLRVGDQVVEATSPTDPQAAAPFRLEIRSSLAAGMVPVELTLDRPAESDPPSIQLAIRRPGDDAYQPAGGDLFMHWGDPQRDAAYRRFTSEMPWRKSAIPQRPRGSAAAAAAPLLAQPPAAHCGSWKDYHHAAGTLLLRWQQAQAETDATEVADYLLRLIADYLQSLSADPSVAPGSHGKFSGTIMRHFLELRGFLEAAIRHPRLQHLALNTRSAMLCHASMTTRRSFFSETHDGTNDGYHDDNNFLTNIWRYAAIWDDPLAYDQARSLYDNHFTYRSGTGDGLHSDNLFTFHNANGRQLHIGGYGSDWLTRVLNANRDGTPWGHTQEQYRRLAEYTLSAEWFYYKQEAVAFTTNGRHNTHRGTLNPAFAQRLLGLREGVLSPSLRKRLQTMVNRSAAGTFVSGSHFFPRHLQLIHRRDDYYLDVKLSAPLVGGPETFAGATPGNLSFGDGVMTILRHGDEYRAIHAYNIPESLWRFRSLPGTTQNDYEWGTLQKWKTLDRYRVGQGGTAGGVSDGRYGHAGFEFVNGTRAKKMFAFLEDGMVVLGAGIEAATESRPGYSYRSTINQCSVRGDITLTKHAKTVTIVEGRVGEFRIPLDAPIYITHHDVGYLVLPTRAEQGPGSPGSLHVRTVMRTPVNRLGDDVWKNQQDEYATYRAECEKLLAGDPPRQTLVLELWIDHGPLPANAQVAYYVCMRPEQVDAATLAANLPFVILANTSGLQAVEDSRDGRIHAFFHQPGQVGSATTTLSVDRPAAVMVHTTAAGQQVLSLQDPLAACSRNLSEMSDTIIVTIDGQAHPIEMPGKGDSDDRYRGLIASRTIQ